jgi:hypothetical protein
MILTVAKNGSLDHNYDGHTIRNEISDKIEKLRKKCIANGGVPTKVYMKSEDFAKLVRLGLYRNFRDIDDEGNYRGWNNDFQYQAQKIDGRQIGEFKCRMWRGLEVLHGNKIKVI